MNSMRWKRGFVWVLILALMSVYAPAAFAAEAAAGTGSTSVEYNFDQDGNVEGWMTSYNGVESFKAEGGALQLKLNKTDPFWYASRNLGLQTSPDQSFTIRMKANKGTSVAFYFDTDLYPGLSQAKMIVIPITADGEYHEYSVKAGTHPNWKGVVRNLRMDLEPASSVPSEVSIDYIRIADRTFFSYEFNGSTNGWSAVEGLSPLQVGSTTVSTSVYGDGVPSIASELIGKSADQIGELKLRTRVDGGAATAIKLSFTTDTSPEFSDAQQFIIPITSNGQFQELIVKLWEHPSWTGTIKQLRLSLVGAAPGNAWELDYLRFQSTVAPHYQWNEAGNAQGWIPAHDVTDFKVANGVLSARVTGRDPNLNVENVDGAIGERDKTMTVRMSATAGDYVSIFFATDQASSYSESRRIDFTITADGSMHDYTIPVGDHPSWRGKITKLRLDLDGGTILNAVMALDDLQLISSPAGAELNMKRSKPALHVGEEADLTVDITNNGGKAFFEPTAELALSQGLEVVGQSNVVTLPDLHSGDKTTISWKVRATTESPALAEVKLHAPGYEQSRSVVLPVLKSYVAPAATKPSHATASIDPSNGNAVLENGQTRIVAVKSDFGFGQYDVYTWDAVTQGWKSMASVQPFASAVVRGADHAMETVAYYPTSVQVGGGEGSAALTFQGTTSDSSGRQWTYSFEFSLEDASAQVKTKQSVQADRNAELLSMIGPVLTVGEGSFGSAKEEALFPGLEWLVGDEVSSSKLDVITPASLRVVPHPYKITVPLMAVRQGGHLVSLSWDPHQKWDGMHDLPAAKFASPNWVENQNNHVMGLSALSVPTYVKENNELAETAYPLTAGKAITLEAGITTAEADSVTQAVSLYLEDQPLPDVPQVRPFEDEVELGLDAYLHTYWNEDAKGWSHVPTWAPYQYPANMVSLKMLAAAAPESKSEVDRVISEAIGALPNKQDLGKPSYHIPQFQAPFLVGYMSDALAGLKAGIQSTIKSQSSSGAWLYGEESRYNPPLGANGTPLSGQTAQNSKNLLQYAMMTGDEQAKEAGFKGLAAFESMGDVPRASQPWEVPLHTPDILAAGHAVGMYVQAYKLTGDEAYLKKAAKWAQAGMPFVYTWGVDDLPMMKYGTIPIFGASAYINPWFAVPVQWNGLVYAYELLELAKVDQSGPWKKLADGILASAEVQQAAAPGEPARGGYPDNWKLIADSRSDGVMLNPEEIVKMEFMKRNVEGLGPNVDVQTTIIPGCPSSSVGNTPCADTRVTTLAEVSNTGASNTQHLVKFDLAYIAGETTYVLVAGRELPRMITVNGQVLTPSDSLNDAESGWSYLSDGGYLVLKIKHSAADNVMIHY